MLSANDQVSAKALNYCLSKQDAAHRFTADLPCDRLLQLFLLYTAFFIYFKNSRINFSVSAVFEIKR